MIIRVTHFLFSALPLALFCLLLLLFFCPFSFSFLTFSTYNTLYQVFCESCYVKNRREWQRAESSSLPCLPCVRCALCFLFWLVSRGNRTGERWTNKVDLREKEKRQTVRDCESLVKQLTFTFTDASPARGERSSSQRGCSQRSESTLTAFPAESAVWTFLKHSQPGHINHAIAHVTGRTDDLFSWYLKHTSDPRVLQRTHCHSLCLSVSCLRSEKVAFRVRGWTDRSLTLADRSPW